MKIITKKFEPNRIAEIHGEECPRNPKKVEETLDAMKLGIPIIHSGVLHNPENKTFGIPDLLVRSDWLKFLVKESYLTSDDEIISAPKLTGSWHYRVVDIKFSTLSLRSDQKHLLNAGSFPAYKSQLLIYNWALGHLQGYTPDQAYILGRSWKYTSKGEAFDGNSCFEKLGVINYADQDKQYIEFTNNALDWLNTVRDKKAAQWNVTKYPLDRWELYPNMCNTHDGQWRELKQKIAEENKELTDLWMVGPKNRNQALNYGVYDWGNSECTPEILGITGEKTSNILESIIKINQSDKILIAPKVIKNNFDNWQKKDKIEFFIDFENHNAVMSNIKNLQNIKTDTIIFMIGVGYCDPHTNEWVYKDFTSNLITFTEEAKICRDFINYIQTISEKYNVSTPKCYHWSQAEATMWFNIVDRHNIDYDEWIWIDMLAIFKDEPITIHGCKSFGLKEVAKTMKNHGFIKSSWDLSTKCNDGQSAMILAYKAHKTALKNNSSMKTLSIIQDIVRYNEIDTKVLYEILDYLRKYHLKSHKSKRRK